MCQKYLKFRNYTNHIVYFCKIPSIYMSKTQKISKVISIKGARQHNLKNISLYIHKNKITVISGVSGSGKSTLAFNTLFAEGQRRYIESLSSYAKQFLGKIQKPDVDEINGICPAIAIEQKTISKNPRSTVGTTTEIYDYLKLLFARVGKTISPISNKTVKRDQVKDIYNYIDIKLPIKDITTNFENYLDKNVEDKYYIKGDVLNVLEAWDELIKHFDIDEKISPTILINEYYMLDRKTNFDKYPKWKKKYIIENEKLINKYKNIFDKWYEKYKTLLGKREIYAKLEWQVGLIKPNDSIFNYFIQIRQSGIRVKKTKYFPTLVAISQIPIYGKEKRYITPKECARLQSFPDNFILSKNDKISYKQLGNAVNVQNVKTVVEATFKHYNIM